MGVIPKKHQPGKWRLIVDLSSPEGHSTNDGISKELASLSYTSVDQVAQCIATLGQGALLAKMDIKQAYRNVPVHPQDRLLLGMRWEQKTLIDTALPFGLRSAPLIFSALAYMLMWIMQQKGARFVFHYLDDYITVGQIFCEAANQPIDGRKDARLLPPLKHGSPIRHGVVVPICSMLEWDSNDPWRGSGLLQLQAIVGFIWELGLWGLL